MRSPQILTVPPVISPQIKILWVNPGTTSLYDQVIAQQIADIKLPNAEVHVVSLDLGPTIKLTNLEYRVYGVEILKPITHLAYFAQANGFDAYAIGCFYDPALHEAREVSGDTIVRAPCEASLQIASTLGNRFSIVIGHNKWKVQMEDQVRAYGFHDKLASFRALGMHIDEFQNDPEKTKEAIRKAVIAAKEEDGAEVIILGCTIESGFGEGLQKELGIPIIDVVQACYKLAEQSALLKKQIGLTPSRLHSMPPPSQKELEASGVFAGEPPIGNHIIIKSN